MTHDEAIDTIRASGFLAEHRGYLGEGSIYAARQVLVDDLKVLDPALVILPRDSSWVIPALTSHGRTIPAEDIEFEDLGAAVTFAIVILRHGWPDPSRSVR